MTPITLWIVLAALLAGAELFTGTFYLLVLALGAGAGALAAHFALALEFQIAVASLVAVLGYGVLRAVRPPTTRMEDTANPNLNIDIGSVVRIADVLADGTIRVSFRGSMWNARLENPGAQPVMNTDYQIAQIQGNVLILKLTP